VTNNYVLRRLRYTFNYNDSKMIELFAKGDLAVTKEEVILWLKKDDDPDYLRCTDQQFAHFLNGLIIEKRGAKDGEKPIAEYALNNNIILRKLKIAFDLKNDDLLELLKNANFILGKAELSAFFRTPEHRHFRECQDQVLRNVLQGLQMRETNTSTAEQQSQYQAIEAKKANKTAAARKEKTTQERAKQGGHSNPYANKPATEKVFYKNPNKTSSEVASEENKGRAKISLNKDKKTAVKKEPANQVIPKPAPIPAPKEDKPVSSDNGGFSWGKPNKN
jgi:uncharacterized protein YehS (DUF1456 family)